MKKVASWTVKYSAECNNTTILISNKATNNVNKHSDDYVGVLLKLNHVLVRIRNHKSSIRK